MKVPDELRKTHEMLKCAFPNGISDNDYLPLIAVLYEHMSHRQLAHIIGILVNTDYALILTDVYSVVSTAIPSESQVERIREQLIPCGYQEWISSE
jgi:hypothetical protein